MAPPPPDGGLCAVLERQLHQQISAGGASFHSAHSVEVRANNNCCICAGTSTCRFCSDPGHFKGFLHEYNTTAQSKSPLAAHPDRLLPHPLLPNSCRRSLTLAQQTKARTTSTGVTTAATRVLHQPLALASTHPAPPRQQPQRNTPPASQPCPLQPSACSCHQS